MERNVRWSVFKNAAFAALVLITGCNEYYLQNASVLAGRKIPTMTASQDDTRRFGIGFSGARSVEATAEYTQGKHTEYVSANGGFDYECASDPDCNERAVNSVPYSGENIQLNSSRWSAAVQLSFTPFYRKSASKAYRLGILAEAQYGQEKKDRLFNFKVGSAFSSIGNRLAIHPKIFFGFSKISADYQGFIRYENEHISLFSDSTFYTYAWKPDSGSIDSYRFFTELGATFEFPLNKKFSVLTDLSGTYQHLFEYYSGENIHLAYAEISPAIKWSVAENLTIVAGVALPYNPDMKMQLSIQGFAGLYFPVGPYRSKEIEN